MVIYSPAISGKYTYFVEVQIRYDRSQHQQSRRAMNKSNLEKKKKKCLKLVAQMLKIHSGVRMPETSHENWCVGSGASVHRSLVFAHQNQISIKVFIKVRSSQAVRRSKKKVESLKFVQLR